MSLPNFSHLRPVAQPTATTPEQPAAPDGITRPLKRNAGPRFLTDVIVELGFTDRERAESAVKAAREAANTPEEVLLGWGAITVDQLARAIAERTGLDHLDLSVFQVDMGGFGIAA